MRTDGNRNVLFVDGQKRPHRLPAVEVAFGRGERDEGLADECNFARHFGCHSDGWVATEMLIQHRIADDDLGVRRRPVVEVPSHRALTPTGMAVCYRGQYVGCVETLPRGGGRDGRAPRPRRSRAAGPRGGRTRPTPPPTGARGAPGPEYHPPLRKAPPPLSPRSHGIPSLRLHVATMSNRS